MPLKVAMPIIRAVGEGENYSPFYTGARERPEFKFRIDRKPRLEDNESDSSPNLELVLPPGECPTEETSLDELLTAYSIFPGILEFFPIDGENGKLRLSFLPPTREELQIPSSLDRLREHFSNLNDFKALSWLYHLNKSYLQLHHIIYREITSESVIDNIVSLLRQITDDSVHTDLTRDEIEFIRETINLPDSDLESFARHFVGDEANQIKIPAGIPLGKIAQQSDRNYKLDIGFFDARGNALNPIYFFRLIIRTLLIGNGIEGEPSINFLDYNLEDDYWGLHLLMDDAHLTDTTISPTWTNYDAAINIHPFLHLLRANPYEDYLPYLEGIHPIGRYLSDRLTLIEKHWRLFVPPENKIPRVSDNEDVRDLLDYYRIDESGGVPDIATHEWRVDDYGFLVYRKKERQYPWDEEAYFTFDGDSLDRITDIYENITDRWFRGRSFNFDDIIGDYQIPSEILVSNIAKESGGNPNACGIEYARDELRGIDCTNTDPAAGPLGYSDQYRRRFPTSRERAAASHPGAIGGGYSWTDLRHDLDSTRCTNYRVSPGLMQTLIADAKGIATGTTSRYIIGFPVRNSDILNWLFEPANAIPIGVIQLNNRRRRWSGYDPIKMRICHGAGSLRLTRSPSQFGYIGSGFINNGQIRNIYWAGYYNATIAFFNNYTGASPPVVRIATVTP